MKFISSLCIALSITVAFIVGQYFSKREVVIEKFTETVPKIIVTEMLLSEYLKSCDKSGYRRFSSFHEHNIDRVLREIDDSAGYPFFLNVEFVSEMEILFSAHKNKHKRFKKVFLENCEEL